MIRKFCFKAISVTTLCCFLSTSVSLADPASVYNITISEKTGKITQRYKGTSNKTVICIEDAHHSLEAQENIANVIDELNKNNQINFIGLEGGVGDLSVESFKAFPIDEARVEAAHTFLKKGLFTGAEYAAIASDNPFTLSGIEDKDLFISNFSQYRYLAQRREEIIEKISAIQTIVSSLEDKQFNKDLRAFATDVRAYQKKSISFTAFLSTLLNYAESRQLDITQYLYLSEFRNILFLQTQINRELAESQKKSLLSLLELHPPAGTDDYTVFQQILLEAQKYDIPLDSFSEFKKEFDYLNKYQSVDFSALLSDINAITLDIKLSLAKSDAEKQLIKWQEFITISKNVLLLEATRKDLARLDDYQSDYSFAQLTHFIDQTPSDFISPESLSNQEFEANLRILDTYMLSALSFYEKSSQRDVALVSNLLNEMESQDIQTGILISGGFHSDGITNKLKQQGINYISLIPAISNTAHSDTYTKKMTGELFPLSPAFTSNIQAIARYIMADKELVTLHRHFREEELIEVLKLALLNKVSPEKVKDKLREYGKLRPEFESDNDKFNEVLAAFQERFDDLLLTVNILFNHNEFTFSEIEKIIFNPQQAKSQRDQQIITQARSLLLHFTEQFFESPNPLLASPLYVMGTGKILNSIEGYEDIFHYHDNPELAAKGVWGSDQFVFQSGSFYKRYYKDEFQAMSPEEQQFFHLTRKIYIELCRLETLGVFNPEEVFSSEEVFNAMVMEVLDELGLEDTPEYAVVRGMVIRSLKHLKDMFFGVSIKGDITARGYDAVLEDITYEFISTMSILYRIRFRKDLDSKHPFFIPAFQFMVDHYVTVWDPQFSDKPVQVVWKALQDTITKILAHGSDYFTADGAGFTDPYLDNKAKARENALIVVNELRNTIRKTFVDEDHISVENLTGVSDEDILKAIGYYNRTSSTERIRDLITFKKIKAELDYLEFISYTATRAKPSITNRMRLLEPALSELVEQLIDKNGGVIPYDEVKKLFLLRAEVETNYLIAIAGNRMDFGDPAFIEMMERGAEDELLNKILEVIEEVFTTGLSRPNNLDGLVVDIVKGEWLLDERMHFFDSIGKPFEDKFRPLITVFHDNAGEDILELIHVEFLLRKGFNVTMVGRHIPVLNDATELDLKALTDCLVGSEEESRHGESFLNIENQHSLDLLHEIRGSFSTYSRERLKGMSSGAYHYGTVPAELTDECKEEIMNSYFCMAFGQGNLEMLWPVKWKIPFYHVLMLKHVDRLGVRFSGYKNPANPKEMPRLLLLNAHTTKQEETSFHEAMAQLTNSLHPLSSGNRCVVALRKAMEQRDIVTINADNVFLEVDTLLNIEDIISQTLRRLISSLTVESKINDSELNLLHDFLYDLLTSSASFEQLWGGKALHIMFRGFIGIHNEKEYSLKYLVEKFLNDVLQTHAQKSIDSKFGEQITIGPDSEDRAEKLKNRWFVILAGSDLSIGSHTHIGPNSIINNSTIGQYSRVSHSYLIDTEVLAQSNIRRLIRRQDAQSKGLRETDYIERLAQGKVSPLESRQGLLRALRKRGVVVVSPSLTFVSDTITEQNLHYFFGNNVTLLPGTVLDFSLEFIYENGSDQSVFIGDNCTIGLGSYLSDSSIGANTRIFSSVITNCKIEGYSPTDPSFDIIQPPYKIIMEVFDNKHIYPFNAVDNAIEELQTYPVRLIFDDEVRPVAFAFPLKSYSLLPESIDDRDYYDMIQSLSEDHKVWFKNRMLELINIALTHAARKGRPITQQQRGKLERQLVQILEYNLPFRLVERFCYDLIAKTLSISPRQDIKRHKIQETFVTTSREVNTTYYDFFKEQIQAISDTNKRMSCTIKLIALSNFFNGDYMFEDEKFLFFIRLVKLNGLENALEHPDVIAYLSKRLNDSEQFVDGLLSQDNKNIVVSLNNSGLETGAILILVEELCTLGFKVTLAVNSRPIGDDLDMRDIHDLFGINSDAPKKYYGGKEKLISDRLSLFFAEGLIQMVSNGSAARGTIPAYTSKELQDVLKEKPYAWIATGRANANDLIPVHHLVNCLFLFIASNGSRSFNGLIESGTIEKALDYAHVACEPNVAFILEANSAKEKAELAPPPLIQQLPGKPTVLNMIDKYSPLTNEVIASLDRISYFDTENTADFFKQIAELANEQKNVGIIITHYALKHLPDIEKQLRMFRADPNVQIVIATEHDSIAELKEKLGIASGFVITTEDDISTTIPDNIPVLELTMTNNDRQAVEYTVLPYLALKMLQFVKGIDTQVDDEYFEQPYTKTPRKKNVWRLSEAKLTVLLFGSLHGAKFISDSLIQQVKDKLIYHAIASAA